MYMTALQAQVTEGGVTKLEDVAPSLDTLQIAQRDTISNDVYIYKLNSIPVVKTFVDSALTHIAQYEINRSAMPMHINTGNVGSSNFSIFYKPTVKTGFHLGHRQHDLYRFKKDSVAFYKIRKPYSQVYFSPGKSQSSFISKALFTRNFAHNINVVIDFNRIHSESIYTHQDVRHTAFRLGLIQSIPQTRFLYSLNFINNSNYESLNGGITDKEALKITFNGIRTNVPVFLKDAYSYHLSQSYFGKGMYTFFKTKSSHLKGFVDVAVDRTLYKYIDPIDSASDTLFYTSDYIPSDLGIRLHHRLMQYQTRVGVDFIYKGVHISPRGIYRINHLRSDNSNKTISEFFGELLVHYEDTFWTFEKSSRIGVSEGKPLLLTTPSLRWKGNKWINGSLSYTFNNKPPDWIENQLLITNVLIYQNSFKNSILNHLWLTLTSPKLGLSTNVSVKSEENIIVFSVKQRRFEQLDTYRDIQANFKHKIGFRGFFLENSVHTYFSNIEVYYTPNYYSTHALKYSNHIFNKKLLVNVGVQCFVFPSYKMPKYMPLVSRLYNDPSVVQNKARFRFDAYASFKVKGFRVFAKYENVDNLWNNKVFYQIENYPQLDARFRFGVSWMLRY